MFHRDTAEKRRLYNAGKWLAPVPPVCTGLWSTTDWIDYIDMHNGWRTGEKTMETLLEGFCRVNGQQGGTLWQFLPPDKNTYANIADMQHRFMTDQEIGLGYESKQSFEKLATLYAVTVVWT